MVSPAPGAAEVELRLILLGSVLGVICHLRGLFPLHASCVSIDGEAVAFCGASGAGKSTTALHLTLRGHGLLSDDVTQIDPTANKHPQVWPAFPRLKLWQDSLESARIERDGLERNRPGQSKYHYRAAEAFHPSPVPLAAIFLLSKAGPGEPDGVKRLSSPMDIIPALDAEVFRAGVGRALGRTGSLLAAQAAIASAVPVYRLTRRFDLAATGNWLQAVETRLRACPLAGDARPKRAGRRPRTGGVAR
ncbi:MAG: HPr kinase/phosphorylase, partial [Brevundimonas sp.]